ncbi:MAG: pentapeptide repeat-containing protein [Eubacteriales bacterium]|nr:pentapeptide repeat-containing protein [Eubacteriales bacterium]
MRGNIHARPMEQALQFRLRCDCEACRGLCCVALYCAKCDGFPADKTAGEPCCFLRRDSRCAVHDQLAARGLKGCISFDCLGAGQRAVQACGGADWRKDAKTAERLFAAFAHCWQLQQMLWYLAEVCTLAAADALKDAAGRLITENERVTAERLDEYRTRVNALLERAASAVRNAVNAKAASRRRADLLGKRMNKSDFSGVDFTGALLIAADLSDCRLAGACLLGADLRDTNLCGADLRDSLFLTQAQLNAARGDGRTRLAPFLQRPAGWNA